jgi:hypothetical protein
MTDRLIKVLEQGKLICRGLKHRGKNVSIAQDSDETLSYSVDWSTWLGSDTIASVINEATGVTVTGASNTTTTTTFNLNASRTGWVEHRITTAAGLTKELLLVVEIDGYPLQDDYGYAWQVV